MARIDEINKVIDEYYQKHKFKGRKITPEMKHSIAEFLIFYSENALYSKNKLAKAKSNDGQDVTISTALPEQLSEQYTEFIRDFLDNCSFSIESGTLKISSSKYKISNELTDYNDYSKSIDDMISDSIVSIEKRLGKNLPEDVKKAYHGFIMHVVNTNEKFLDPSSSLFGQKIAVDDILICFDELYQINPFLKEDGSLSLGVEFVDNEYSSELSEFNKLLIAEKSKQQDESTPSETLNPQNEELPELPKLDDLPEHKDDDVRGITNAEEPTTRTETTKVEEKVDETEVKSLSRKEEIDFLVDSFMPGIDESLKKSILGFITYNSEYSVIASSKPGEQKLSSELSPEERLYINSLLESCEFSIKDNQLQIVVKEGFEDFNLQYGQRIPYLLNGFNNIQSNTVDGLISETLDSLENTSGGKMAPDVRSRVVEFIKSTTDLSSVGSLTYGEREVIAKKLSHLNLGPELPFIKDDGSLSLGTTIKDNLNKTALNAFNEPFIKQKEQQDSASQEVTKTDEKIEEKVGEGSDNLEISEELASMVDKYCDGLAEKGIEFDENQRMGIALFVMKFMSINKANAVERGHDVSNLNTNRAIARILRSMSELSPKFDENGILIFNYPEGIVDSKKALFESAREQFNAERIKSQAKNAQQQQTTKDVPEDKDKEDQTVDGQEDNQEQNEAPKQTETKTMAEILGRDAKGLADRLKGYNINFAQKFLKTMYENLMSTKVVSEVQGNGNSSSGKSNIPGTETKEDKYPKIVKKVPPDGKLQEVDISDPTTWLPQPLYNLDKDGNLTEISLDELLNLGLSQQNPMQNIINQMYGGMMNKGFMGVMSTTMWPMIDPRMLPFIMSKFPMCSYTQNPINEVPAGSRFTEQEIREMYAFNAVGSGINAKMNEVLQPQKNEKGEVIPESEESKKAKGLLAADISGIFTLLSSTNDIPILDTTITSLDNSRVVKTNSFKNIIRDAVMQFATGGKNSPEFKKSMLVIEALISKGEAVFPADLPPEQKQKLVQQMKSLSRGIDGLSQVFEASDLMLMFEQSSTQTPDGKISSLGGQLDTETLMIIRNCPDPYSMMTLLVTASLPNCQKAVEVAQDNMTQVPENLAIYAQLLLEEQRKQQAGKAQDDEPTR